jgi:hypothetical protein
MSGPGVKGKPFATVEEKRQAGRVSAACLNWQSSSGDKQITSLGY